MPLPCWGCGKELPRTAFSNAEWAKRGRRGHFAHCKTCVASDTRLCAAGCGNVLTAAAFSKSQLARHPETRRCRECVDERCRDRSPVADISVEPKSAAAAGTNTGKPRRDTRTAPRAAVGTLPVHGGAVAGVATAPLHEVWSLQFDGAARPNPGRGGWGAAMAKPFQWSGFGVAGCDATSNTAEYTGLIRLLRQVEYRLGTTSGTPLGLQPCVLGVEGDSELVIKQILGEYAVDNTRLQCFHAVARGIVNRLNAKGWTTTFTSVPREHNTVADSLARKGADEARRYPESERVEYYPSRMGMSLVAFDNVSPKIPASNDLGANGGDGFHLIDAETMLQIPALGRQALSNLVDVRSRDGHAIEICTANGGNLVVLGRLAEPIPVHYCIDATPGRENICKGSFTTDQVLVVDHLPVPFHLCCRDAADFPTRELKLTIDHKTTSFDCDAFPATFRDRPFWTSRTIYIGSGLAHLFAGAPP
eukprot:m.465077 g.465077  ORF g.465077 m.465077 type:complete len:476 (-) comp23959_c0_seq1:145-1572(-)